MVFHCGSLSGISGALEQFRMLTCDDGGFVEVVKFHPNFIQHKKNPGSFLPGLHYDLIVRSEIALNAEIGRVRRSTFN